MLKFTFLKLKNKYIKYVNKNIMLQFIKNQDQYMENSIIKQ